MRKFHLTLLTLATILFPNISFSKTEHDLSANCHLYNFIFTIDDGPANADPSNNTLLMYKSIDELDQKYKKIKLPVSINDPEGLACELDNLFVVTGEYDKLLNANFLTYHFKISQEGKSFKVELIKTIPTLDIIQQELINIFTENKLKEILNKKSKEGGVNIEGLALTNGILSFGLRSPLINGNAIIITTHINKIDESTGSFIFDLKNKGIRGLDSYLGLNNELEYYAVAGPADKKGSFALWNFSQSHSEIISDLSRLCRPESVVRIPSQNMLFIQSELSGDACKEATVDSLRLFPNQQFSF